MNHPPKHEEEELKSRTKDINCLLVKRRKRGCISTYSDVHPDDLSMGGNAVNKISK